ncbi:DUF3307 domain-containing protein [Halomonas heilongjiangensis]|uniref:DUF3307 domain-containing protein n=1 Tax=Halomonas heilongjiangensis TaxID=1387883 RepID=A0A2N7TK44_9GAMM|nr:DUF3307 domain-containing protein [Halomonas heilongjiangensis]PMR68566.1 DUF3307 domain-containing protein [Halomonas heilongjiangensis]PXX86725.1 hypothetical protein CR158_22740 [Halomonas heilongjiangensis]
MSPNELSLLLGLVLAHLIGDFVLQPRHWVEERVRRLHRSRHLLYHIAVHGCLTALTLLVAAQLMPGSPGLPAVLTGALGVAASHWLIDLIKARLPGKLRWFLLDQALHLVVLCVLWLAWLGSLAPLESLGAWLLSPTVLGVAAAYLIVTRPFSFAIAMVMKRWSSQLEDTGTLAQAGARIGMLERLLVLSLVLLDQLTAVGFLLTAKSVLRYGDLRDSKDRKLTEYVLLGTLVSVASTLVLGLTLRLLLET